MMFFLIFDHWAFLSGFDMDQYDIGVNLFEIFYLTSGVFCILYMYILIYDRYLLWDIFNDKYSMLKKRFFKVMIIPVCMLIECCSSLPKQYFVVFGLVH